MKREAGTTPNLRQTVPFFAVSDMAASLGFYTEGLGFVITQQWRDGEALRWVWLERGGAALMLQQYPTQGHDAWVPEGKVGQGVATYFICDDALALYRELIARGIEAKAPFVGNGMWVVGLRDPDGYRLYFESTTDAAEGTAYRDRED